jgi:short subunit dehydrogenase-like uncharacterized protein
MRIPDPRPAREFDLIVFGATGYTGRLVAEAVARRAPAGFRWTIAGRDPKRLEKVRHDLGLDAGAVVADAGDAASLAAMARRTRAIVTTVGPYARYGTPLVAACVEAGTDCADLTGEPLWMRETIGAFHDRARATGARIVHACGFDSVPSDLGMFVLQAAAQERHGRPCREIVHAFGPMAGGVSGGTVASGLDLLETTVGDSAARRALADPDLLVPGGTPSPDPVGPTWPRRHPGLDGWTAPFVMAATNAKVVRRTRHLLGEPWGDVRYLERLRATTWARAAAIGMGTTLATAAMALGPVRRLAARFVPKPGEGPSEAARQRGFFRTTLVGRVDDATPPVIAHVEADADPGYGATSRMLAEVGLGLALGEFDAPGGVSTPAVAGGARLVERLGEVGVRIVV